MASSSIIKLQPFCDLRQEIGAHCYLFQIDEFRFLLDCGWDLTFSDTYLVELKKHLHQIDCILLTYPDVYHLGALPLVVGKYGLGVPIYATVPVFKMGQMFMYDIFQAYNSTEEFDQFSLDDVDLAFEKITQLKYMQTAALRGKGRGLEVTPIPAGHMLGGTMWKIRKDGEEEFVYTVDFNHKKERHLNGCHFDSILRPSLLITDSLNAMYAHAKRRERDDRLLAQIQRSVRAGGNVLLPCDTAGRALELAILLEQFWRNPQNGLLAYSVAFLNSMTYNVMEFAKSQMEWMSDQVMKSFEDNRFNPFQFKHIQLCHTRLDLDRLSEPKVVLATSSDLQCGFARELFCEWADSSRNSVILTFRPPVGTLSYRLLAADRPPVMSVELKYRIKLEGVELQQYLEKKKADEWMKQQQEVESSSSESEDEELERGPAHHHGGPTHAQHHHHHRHKYDLMMESETKSHSGFFKHARKAHTMFPFVEDKKKWDDWGEVIRAEDFTYDDEMIVPDGGDSAANSDQTLPKVASVAADEQTANAAKEVAPTRCVSTVKSFRLEASVVFIDFEGRSDGDSVKKILSQIRARNLILVRGSRESTEHLAAYCRSSEAVAEGGLILCPEPLQFVDATREKQIYQVRLKDQLVSRLRFQKARNCELAWLDGRLDYSDRARGAAPSSAGGELEDSSAEVLPTLVHVPTFKKPFHNAVFVNAPKLTDLKPVLIRAGVQAEFTAGALVCNGCVAIKRVGAGRVTIEGCLSEDYYRIRQILYDQFAIL